ALYQASRTDYPFETLPVADPWFGPGSLAAYLGSPMGLQPDTAWFHPCIGDPDACRPIRLDPENQTWKWQLALMDRMIAAAAGRYLVGSPDLVENWDVLGSLRDTQLLLLDMFERPEWVKQRIAEINEAWLQAYEVLYHRIRQQDGGSMFGWFRTWAPGKVAKVQCDGSSMFSPEMFREFVVPALSRQCEWLDYSLFHLDGSQCLCHLDALLEIDALTAIEWTPDPNVPTCGSPHWYDLYRRILKAGKRVQVLGAQPHEIEPLLDAVGQDGIYFLSFLGGTPEREVEAFAKVLARARKN
ncbi:MAG: cobalamin-binding protein, partial [bacterium]